MRISGEWKMRTISDIKKQRGRSGLAKEVKIIVRCAERFECHFYSAARIHFSPRKEGPV